MHAAPRTSTLVAVTSALALILVVSACGSPTQEGTDSNTEDTNTLSPDRDAVMTSRVSDRLATERRLRNSQISVSSADGTVTLTGVVADEHIRSDAEVAARSVAGVQQVDNALAVVDGNMNSSATREMVSIARQAVADSGIATRVRAQLRSDALLRDAQIAVETRLGVVTMTGTAPSPAAIDRAQSIARRVEGVRRVDVTALTLASE
jgi:hyperosmotically inducible periplasmic protein